MAVTNTTQTKLPVVVQTLAVSSGAPSITSAAFGKPLNSPSSILVFIWYEGTTGVTVTDLAGNNYARDKVLNSGTDKCEIWRAQNTSTRSSNTITVSISGSSFITFCAMEVIPQLLLDGSGSTNTSASGSPSTGSVSFSANSLVVATFADTSVASITTPPTGYTLISSSITSGTNEDGSANYRLHTTAGSENPSWTASVSANWSAVAQSYTAITTQFQEAGSNATGDMSFYDSTTGSATSVTAISRSTDPRSIKCTCDGSGNPSYAQKNSILADAGRRLSAYYYFDALPDNGNDSGSGRCFLAVINASSNVVLALNIRSTGVLTVSSLNNAASAFKAGTTVLTSATWNRISISYTITSTANWSAKVYIGGSLEISASNADFSLTNTTGVHWQSGWITGVTAGMANKNLHFADVYVDNGTDLNDVCRPGYQRGVTDKKATIIFQNNWDTQIGNGTLNGVPISTNNGIEQLNATWAVQTYTLELPNAGDRDLTAPGITIISHTGWIYAKQTTAGAGLVKIINNNTENDVALTSSAAVYAVTIDTCYGAQNGVGMRDDGNSQGTFLYGAGAIVSYDTTAVR